MQLRRALVAYQVIGNADQAFAAGNSCRISDRLRGPFGFEGKRQQKPVVASPAIEHVQPRQQLEFARAVADGFSDLKTTPQRRFGLIAVALGEHESVSESRLQLQFPCAAAGRIVEHRERAARPEASFVQQVELDKQPGAGCGQRHAQSSALIIGESPLQRGTRVGKQQRPSSRTRGLVATARHLPPSSPARAGHSGHAGARYSSLHRFRRAFASHKSWWCQEADSASRRRQAAPRSATWRRVAPTNPQCARPDLPPRLRPWPRPAT